MNEIIKIQTNDNLEQVVSARELHEKLGAKQDFSSWFKYQSEKLGLIENTDFSLLTKFGEQTGRGGHNKIDYLVPIDIAKHIAMISGGEKAHEIRRYFIEVERAWNDPDLVMARSLQFAQKKLLTYTEKVKLLEARVEQDKPKVIFADAVAVSKTSILIGDLAKILKQNGIDTGQKRLFDWLRGKGYLMKQGQSKNMPTQRSMELGLFEVKESTINNPDGSVRITKTTKVTGKGQQYFVNAFLGGTT